MATYSVRAVEVQDGQPGTLAAWVAYTKFLGTDVFDNVSAEHSVWTEIVYAANAPTVQAAIAASIVAYAGTSVPNSQSGMGVLITGGVLPGLVGI